MTNDRHNLIAFCAILFAICYLATIAEWLQPSEKTAMWPGEFSGMFGEN